MTAPATARRIEIQADAQTHVITYAAPMPGDPRRPAYEAACRRAGERLAAAYRQMAEDAAAEAARPERAA